MLPTLPAESVQCVVTSPPYWGLRDYGVDAQIGLEPTPEAYVETMVGVFREVRRVLRDDGTLWLNMGDGYASGEIGRHDNGSPSCDSWERRKDFGGRQQARLATGLKPKDLVGMPWRLAFALQADGWFLRSDIIWAKPNPMPESVTDRPTKAHEYIFLLSKQARYYYDAAAIAEPASENTHSRGTGIGLKNAVTPFGLGVKHNQDYASAINVSERNARTVWSIASAPFSDWTKTVRLIRVAPCAAADDTLRIGLPDCRAHAGQSDRVPTAFHDARVAGELSRMLDTPIDRVQARLASPAPIGLHRARCSARGSWDWPRPPCGVVASARNNGSHKTAPAPATSPACTPSVQRPVHTGDRQAGLDFGDWAARIPASSSAADCGEDAPDSGPSAETPCDICGTCTCAYVTLEYQEMSHFATFPPELARRCILAGTSAKGACGACGAPWEREVEREITTTGNGRAHIAGGDRTIGVGWEGTPRATIATITTGWRPTCAHDTAPVPCVVLDPFAGSGTVGEVAERNGRHAVLVELSETYGDLIRERTAQRCLFAQSNGHAVSLE